MNELLPKAPLLERLKRYAEQNKSEPWIPVKAVELLALVECAEALQLAMAILKHEALDKIPVIRALDKGRDAIANLEAVCQSK